VDELLALDSVELQCQLRLLGLSDADLRDTLTAVRTVAASAELTSRLADRSRDVVAELGRFLDRPAPLPTFLAPAPVEQTGSDAGPAAAALPTRVGADALALLAYVDTASDVRRFHSQRGVPADISAQTLADLGRQTGLHRRAHGRYGLENYPWLRLHWTGALYQLGRLQIELRQVWPDRRWDARLPAGVAAGDWVAGLHIPESGPLTEASVRDSLDRIRPFLNAHFPEVSIEYARCASWMLDPQLADVLPTESNLIRFQRLFTLDGLAQRGDEDIVYFICGQRGMHDLELLPRTTRLQLAVLERIQQGGHWHIAQGWVRLP
jgi:GNAT domain-containint protein/N-acyltransferase family protein